MKELNILYQSDDNYAVYMGVSICSLLENNKLSEKITVWIIDDGIGRHNKEKIRHMAEHYHRDIVFVSGEKVLADSDIQEAFQYQGARKNVHSYLKLFWDALLPDVKGRLIYIDCDTAVTGSLDELNTVDMGQKTVGMVMDSLVINSKKAIGFAPTDRYYNSGVLLIDTERWRQRRCSTRILNHIKNIRKYGTIDQDVLNVELKEEIMPLPVKYNLQPVHLAYPYKTYARVYKHKEPYYSEAELAEAVNSPTIIHYLRYIGESPWNADNVHPGTVFFDRYLQLSPWPDYKKKDASNSAVFKLEKWMYVHFPKRLFLEMFYIIHERMILNNNKVA